MGIYLDEGDAKTYVYTQLDFLERTVMYYYLTMDPHAK